MIRKASLYVSYVGAILFVITLFITNNNAYAFFDQKEMLSSPSQITIGAWLEGTEGLTYTLIDGTYEVSLGTAGNETTIIIPPTFNGVEVTTISSGFLQENTVVTSLFVLADVPVIDAQQFRGATALETIEFFNEVETLGNQTVRDTSSLISIYFRDNFNIVPDTHNLTFRDSSLQDVYVPDSMVTSFSNDGAFSDFNIIGL